MNLAFLSLILHLFMLTTLASVIQIATNPIYHECTRHIKVDCHYIQEIVDIHVIFSFACFHGPTNC